MLENVSEIIKDEIYIKNVVFEDLLYHEDIETSIQSHELIRLVSLARSEMPFLVKTNVI